MEETNEAITCPECGTVNPAGRTICMECGFNLDLVRNQEPATTSAALERESISEDFERLNMQLAEWERDRRQRVLVGLTVYQVVLLTVIAVLVVVFTSRFLREWPFPGSFQVDSDRMANALLKVAATVEMETTKSGFEQVLAEMMAESIRYEGKYGTTHYRNTEVYSSLHSAAELYALANEAWDKQLTAIYGHRVSTALSSSAGSDVRKLWSSARSNIRRALEKM